MKGRREKKMPKQEYTAEVKGQDVERVEEVGAGPAARS